MLEEEYQLEYFKTQGLTREVSKSCGSAFWTRDAMREIWCAYPWQGKLVGGGPMLTSLDRHLGTVRPLGTAQFGFGAADYFDRDPFTSRCRLQDKERDDQIRRSQRMLAQSFDYAHARGLEVCLGFELVGDPTDAQVQAHLEARISALLGNYPMLDAVWFFQSENMGNAGTEVNPGTPLDALVQKHAATRLPGQSPARGRGSATHGVLQSGVPHRQAAATRSAGRDQGLGR